ncbi:MAG: hypothetical protein CL946_04855 [Ectothiorhodospiraceae bacterium]|nr:hypothetical protein [Ectothiorhodospiraceae bacterium]
MGKTQKNTPIPPATQTKNLFLGAGIFILAFAVRFIVLLQFQDIPFYDHHFSDTGIYAGLAKQLLEGSGIEGAYFMSPLYPYFIAAVTQITGEMEFWARMLQCMAGAGTVLLLYLFGRRYFDAKVGIVSALIASFYAPLVFHDNLLLIESFQALFLVAHLYTMARALETGRMDFFIRAGLLLGIAVLNRSNIIFLLLAYIPLFYCKREAISRPMLTYGVIAASCIILLLPFVVRNSAIEGELTFITTSGGYNLYAGNNSATEGLYKVPEAVDISSDPNGVRFAEQATGASLTNGEASDYWADKAFTWIGDNPGRFLVLLGQKFVLFFHPEEIEQIGVSLDFVRMEYDTALNWLVPGFIFVLPLFVFGIISAAFEKKREAFLPALVLGVYILVTIVFFVNGRLRIPVMPIMILFAGYGAVQLYAMLVQKEYQRLLKPVAAAGVCIAALLLLQPSYEPAYETEYNRLGDIAFIDGEYTKAAGFFERSLQTKRTAVTLTNLGNAYAASGRFGEAEKAYEEALRLDKQYAPALFNKGNMAHQRGKLDVAYTYWTKAVEIDPNYAPVRRNLGLLLMQAGRFKDALLHLQAYVDLEQDPQQRAPIQQDIETIKGILQGE